MEEAERWFEGESPETLEKSDISCPRCGEKMYYDRWGECYLKCFRCGLIRFNVY